MIYLVLILTLVSLVIANYMRRKQEERRMLEQDRREEKFEQMMERLKKRKDDSIAEGSTADEVCDATEDDG